MTADQQLAVNARTLMAAAARLERAGYTGDAYRFVESLIVNALADGYRPIPQPPPPRGAGSSERARAEALAAAAEAVRAAKVSGGRA